MYQGYSCLTSKYTLMQINVYFTNLLSLAVQKKIEKYLDFLCFDKITKLCD